MKCCSRQCKCHFDTSSGYPTQKCHFFLLHLFLGRIHCRSQAPNKARRPTSRARPSVYGARLMYAICGSDPVGLSGARALQRALHRHSIRMNFTCCDLVPIFTGQYPNIQVFGVIFLHKGKNTVFVTAFLHTSTRRDICCSIIIIFQ